MFKSKVMQTDKNKKLMKVSMLPTEKAENCIIKKNGRLYHHVGQIFTQSYLQSISASSYNLHIVSNKIEASTDKSLGLPLIPEGFVRKYCELQGGIEQVMVDVEYVVTNEDWSKRPVQLDGYYKTKTDKNNYITITKVKTTFTLDEMFMNMQYYMEYCERNGYVTPQDWLEK